MQKSTSRPTVVAPAPEHVQRGERSRQLILAVEDDREDWRIYGKMLWYNGFDVIHASSGEDGLRLARSEHPDAVLADLMLPGMNGIDLCRALKRDPGCSDIPVIMLTARSYREFGAAAEEAGCDLFLEKPVGPVEVLHVIEERIGRAPRYP